MTITNASVAAQSHYMLWRKCVTENKPIMILEHDAIFTKKFDGNILEWWYPVKEQLV